MFNGVLALKNCDKRCFPSFLKVRKKDKMQRCLHLKKQIVLTVKKRCFHSNFKMQKRKGVYTVFQLWEKRCFNFAVKKSCFDGVSKVAKRLLNVKKGFSAMIFK